MNYRLLRYREYRLLKPKLESRRADSNRFPAHYERAATREGAAADASLLVLSTVFLCGDLSLFSVRAARNLRACANRRATFRTWQLLERLHSLLTAPYHIRYSPIGAASKARYGRQGGDRHR